ncbi:hypothetical protein BpHYR1_002511 [Brachionus plicatilis]|uniref:Uncharacterized protein n=1 Tax=Brachionus plicatilis TaxID=10195 RepID=A0A3M7RBH6_BRAPC|nr:hypothetical protein BpHYR1_002511 [Brachionus plicatilis]
MKIFKIQKEEKETGPNKIIRKSTESAERKNQIKSHFTYFLNLPLLFLFQKSEYSSYEKFCHISHYRINHIFIYKFFSKFLFHLVREKPKNKISEKHYKIFDNINNIYPQIHEDFY